MSDAARYETISWLPKLLWAMGLPPLSVSAILLTGSPKWVAAPVTILALVSAILLVASCFVGRPRGFRLEMLFWQLSVVSSLLLTLVLVTRIPAVVRVERGEHAESGKLVRIPTPAEPLPRGHRIQADDLTLKPPIARKYLPDDLPTRDDLIGRRVLHAWVDSELPRPQRVAEQGDAGLVAAGRVLMPISTACAQRLDGVDIHTVDGPLTHVSVPLEQAPALQATCSLR